jgi:hypothetical protein
MPGYQYASGSTGILGVYCSLRNLNLGQIWNGSANENYNQAHWSEYVVDTPEDAGSGEYKLTVPGALPAGLIKATFYNPENPASPAPGDTPFDTEIFVTDGSGGVMSVGSALNVGAINGSAPAAVNLSKSSNAFVVGAAAAGTLTSSTMTTNLSLTVANIIAGRTLYFTSGVNASLAVLVTAYAVTGGLVTFVAYNNQPAPSAPSAADTFLVI